MSKIDYQYWCRLDSWRPKEAALLLDGKDPDEYRSIRHLGGKDSPTGLESAIRISTFLSRVNWQSRYGYSQHQVGENPAFIVRTALDADLEVPPDLLMVIEPRLKKLDAWLKKNQEQEEIQSSTASTKERQTMLKLILGFAWAAYKMPLDGGRNQRAKEMRADLEQVGFPLDDDTIKKYLDEARQLRKRQLASSR